MERNFQEMLQDQWNLGKCVCVGLDTEYNKIPDWFKLERGNSVGPVLQDYNFGIIEATCDLVCAYKPNIAFYEAWGALGLKALVQTIEFIQVKAPGVPVILDAKRGDIGNTNLQYVKMAFEFFKADAITIHPYLGAEASRPFLEQKNKGIFVLCKTSNPGAGEFQDQMLEQTHACLFHEVATQVAREWNENNNCCLVVGATYPEDLAEVRKIVGPAIPILIPGIGKQQGDLEATVKAGKNSYGQGMIINSSRGVIFASQEPGFDSVARQKVKELQKKINQYL